MRKHNGEVEIGGADPPQGVVRIRLLDEVVHRLTNGRGHPLRSMSELPFEGLLVHVAAQTGDGFLIFDPFESREACEQFGKTMGTRPQEVGITEALKLFEAHTFLASCDSRHPAAA